MNKLQRLKFASQLTLSIVVVFTINAGAFALFSFLEPTFGDLAALLLTLLVLFFVLALIEADIPRRK